MKKAIIVDIDGTISDSRHRTKYVDGSLGKKDWDSFYEKASEDKPNEWCEELLYACSLKNIKILFITGRPEKYRDTTIGWLMKLQGSYLYTWTLDMRADGDFRPDYMIKKEIYEKKLKGIYDILFAIDDRKQVVDMWRSLGITCLQCDNGEF